MPNVNPDERKITHVRCVQAPWLDSFIEHGTELSWLLGGPRVLGP